MRENPSAETQHWTLLAQRLGVKRRGAAAPVGGLAGEAVADRLKRLAARRAGRREMDIGDLRQVGRVISASYPS